MTQKRTSAADTPIRVVVVTMDSHLSSAAARAEAALRREMPGLELKVHAADEWGGDEAALAECRADIARGDVVIATMLFLEDHIRAVQPALAARREDIPLLFLQLMREAAARHSLPEREVPPALLAGLAARDWPGNVRELRNLAERTVLGLEETDPEADPGGAGTCRLPDRVAAFERSLIAGAIAAHGGRLRAVYESLGISRKTLYEKMQKYGLDRRLIVEPAEDRDA